MVFFCSVNLCMFSLSCREKCLLKHWVRFFTRQLFTLTLSLHASKIITTLTEKTHICLIIMHDQDIEAWLCLCTQIHEYYRNVIRFSLAPNFNSTLVNRCVALGVCFSSLLCYSSVGNFRIHNHNSMSTLPFLYLLSTHFSCCFMFSLITPSTHGYGTYEMW